MTLTRQCYRQLRRAVEQGRKVAELVIPRVPFRPFTDEEQAEYEERQDRRDNADGPEEDREWEVRE